MKNYKGIIAGVSIGIVLIIAIILVAVCTEKIPAGYCGVVYNMRNGVAEETLSQGWHVVSPMKKITLYSIGIEQSYLTSKSEGDSPNDDSFEAPTSDGKGLTMDLTFTYRFDPDRVSNTFTRFKGRSGKEVLTTFIKPNIIAWTKEVTAQYPVTEIIGEQRAMINSVLADYIKNKFDPYGIIIETVSLIDINPDEETREQIQKKVNASQQLELAEIERNTAKIQAEKEKEVALINAEKEKEAALITAEQEKEVASIQAEQAQIKAQGKAEAVKIEAEAQAEANKMIASSVTPEIIEMKKIEKWSGAVPMVSGENTPIISITENNE